MTDDMRTRRSVDFSKKICAPSQKQYAQIESARRTVRNDIEGLRALAVLSVLANHAFPRALPGGFAGVDIFFVISGYLIGRHLLQDIQAGRLSILGFYAKRARRIFPALALLLIAVWCIGWVVFSAPEFAALGRQLLAATFFSNNVLLWSESGYFDTTALDKPLLHLWSLGIEEQFYLLVPTLLWLGTSGVAGSIRWVARLGALSLLATILLSNFDYAASCYLLHTRFWELAVGVVLAQVELRSAVQSPGKFQAASQRDLREITLFSLAVVFSAVLVLGSNEGGWKADTVVRDSGLVFAIAVAGAAAILAECHSRRDVWKRLWSWGLRHRSRFAPAASIAGVILTAAALLSLNSTAWPGAQTLFPVLGTALVIAARPRAMINKLLAWKPLVFIGGISYPLYLWHWPAIVIFRFVSPEPRAIEMAIPLTASVVLAWFTKTFIEDPVRFGTLGSTSFRRPALWPVVSALVFAAALGSSVVATRGLPSRFSPQLRAVAEWSEDNPDSNWRVGLCYHYLNKADEYSGECTPTKRPGVPLVLLWGDSHAAQLYPGMANLQSTVALDIAQWTVAGCPPTVRPLRGEASTCSARRAADIAKLARFSPDAMVLGGAWERYLEWGEPADEIVNTVSETIRRLKKLGIKQIVIFGPGPLWTTSLPVDLFRFMAKSGSSEIPARLGRVSAALWRLDDAMAAAAAAEKIQYVSILNFFCDKAGCLTIGNRASQRPDLLYRDQDHLTVSGSKLLIAHSAPQILGHN
jgi:peptidoglycan/LPS O-acetylase OafA/YrhL